MIGCRGLLGLVIACLLAVVACTPAQPPRAPNTPTPAPPAPSKPAGAAAAAPKSFEPYWVKNHRITEMWSGPAGQAGVVSSGQTSRQFCSFLVERPQDNARLSVMNPYAGDRIWIDAEAVGPAPAPERGPGPRPTDQNCTDVLYEPASAAAPPPTPAPAAGPRADRQPDERLVLALYYPWSMSATTSDAGGVGGLPPIERHVRWSRDAGIDVLVSAWYGPHDSITNGTFEQLLRLTQPEGINAGLLFETENFDGRPAMVTALRHFVQVHAEHPNYFRVGGRPVILVWRPIAVFGPNGQRVDEKSPAAVAAWRSLLDEVDPQRRALWIAEGDYFPFLEVFDGIFPYSIAWSPNPAAQLQSYGQRTRDFSAQARSQKLWIATAMPGYDDTGIAGRPGTFAVDRANGAYYQTTFRGAIASRPSWIVITSFNEWLEGTQIEPAPAYGTRYLDLTKQFGGEFRRGPLPCPLVPCPHTRPSPLVSRGYTARARLPLLSVPRADDGCDAPSERLGAPVRADAGRSAARWRRRARGFSRPGWCSRGRASR